MKTKMVFVALLFAAVACKKEDSLDLNPTATNPTASGTGGPMANPTVNFMDDYGNGVADAIQYVNNLNLIKDPNLTEVAAGLKYKDDLIQFGPQFLPASGELISEQGISYNSYELAALDEFFPLLQNLDINEFLNETSSLEEFVVNSNEMTVDGKKGVLLIISIFKHLHTTILTKGIMVNGTDITYQSPWDTRWNNCMKNAIGDDGPFTNFAWVVSGTVFLTMADCIGTASNWW